MKALFKSTELQTQFERDGFVKTHLLNAIQVEQLLNYYKTVAEQHEAIGIPYITTSHSNNTDLITQVDQMLQQVLAPELEKILKDYKLLFGNFLIKMPVANSETDPHQDITFVDEAEFVSVNIWVALQDTTQQNGCMFFMRGSHKLVHTIRPTHHYKWKYELVKEEIKARSENFEAKAGDAFIFHHGVLHGSFPNNSTRPRIAAVIAAYSADAALIHYYLPDLNSNRLQKYAMNKEAYLSFVKQLPPAKGVYLCDEEFDFTPMSKKEFLQLADGKKNWLQKISSLWNRHETVTT